MQLSTLKCPACGASVSVEEGSTKFKCEYCSNTISIIKPVAIENKFVESLTEIDQRKFENYISILHQSMLAGNYGEGYTYCNKALEINPKAAGIWENKAICAFWLSHVKQFEEDKAIEIVTYLNASRQSDPDSPTYEQTCKDLAENLYWVVCYLYNSMQFDNYVQTSQGSRISGYTLESQRRMLSYMRLFEVCYQIYPDVKYLKEFVICITNGRGLQWVYKSPHNQLYSNTQTSNSLNLDAVSKRNQLIDKIKSIEPDYIPPGSEVKKKSHSGTIIAFCVIVFFILLVFICANLGKH